MKTYARTKLSLSSQTIRQLQASELQQVSGGNSVNCTKAGVSLCVVFGCTQPPLR